MHFNKRIATVAIVFVIAGMSPTAHATRFWSSIGGGCVPADEDIQADNYDQRGFGVGFKGFATGDIRLLCPIALTTANIFRSFRMSYKDTDGMSTQARIRATLRVVNDGSNVSRAIGTVDSNTSNATGNNILFFNHVDIPTINPQSYFFEILIERTSSAQDPEFLAVAEFDDPDGF